MAKKKEFDKRASRFVSEKEDIIITKPKAMNPKTGNKIAGCIIGGIVLFIVLMIIAGVSGSKDKADKVAVSPTSTATTDQKTIEPAKTETPKPTPIPVTPAPTLTEGQVEAVNDKDLILNCVGGDKVSLWDKPTDFEGGARPRGSVPCGTIAFAENKFYNEKFKITFYDVTINDKRVKTGFGEGYGWVTEDLITWK